MNFILKDQYKSNQKLQICYIDIHAIYIKNINADHVVVLIQTKNCISMYRVPSDMCQAQMCHVSSYTRYKQNHWADKTFVIQNGLLELQRISVMQWSAKIMIK